MNQRPQPRKGPRPAGRRPDRQGPPPLEAAARSTRNALRRHAEGLRDAETRLACRAVLSGLVAGTSRVASPGEVLGIVEQVLHGLESSRPDASQLPTTLRAVVDFAREKPGRSRQVAEALRLTLRHGYALAADHIPRQARDDGPFRASALRDVITEAAAEYLDDESFRKAAT